MKNKITVNCQSSIRIADNEIIYFDPYKILKESHDADLIFITHDHFDHFDTLSIENIRKEDTKIIVPHSISKIVKESLDIPVIEVEPNNTYNINGYLIKTIPSYNLNKNFHPKEKNYVGYVITIQEERIYVSGDMDLIEEALNLKCDIALIPIGGTYTMNYKEALTFVNKVHPKVVIPTHYQTIVGSLDDALEFQKLVPKDIECLILYK